MKFSHFFFVLVCFCFSSGLTAQSTLSGNWQMTVPTEDGGTMKVYLSFGADNTYSVDLAGDGTTDIKGKYELKDGQLTIQDNGGPEACTGKGLYKVETTETLLKMTRISDPCEGRGGPAGVMEFSRR